MQSGFNTNIRYRGVLFHVQSEDSGRKHPHIITHLYHGGTILVSEKSSYEDQVEDPNLEEVVKRLMENQHKAVLKRLVAADYDHLIRSRLGEDVFQDGAGAADAGADSDRTGPLEPTRPPEPAAAAVAEEPSLPEVQAEPEPHEQEPDGERAFGEGIVSEKPLDEVILGYLVENARKRKRQRQ